MMEIDPAAGPDEEQVQHRSPADEMRRPRIAIMGEFSAGKSTLSNLLIGAPSLPVKVTATQLPPVWISYGEHAPYRVDVDGAESPIDLNNLDEISVEDTLYVRVFHKSDALELCDLIDMPGISDPNMASEVWERVLHHADGVIWCTHATQAWRQSEAAVWSMVDPNLYQKSLLLLTRIDKILNEKDRVRVARRVESETDGLFAGVFPVSLTAAIEAGDDLERWQKSGAEAFALALIELIETMTDQPALGRPIAETEAAETEAPAEDDRSDNVTVLAKHTPQRAPADAAPKVMPRRVRRSSEAGQRTVRPAPEDGSPQIV